MFSEGDRRLYVGSGTGSDGIRGRLHGQVYPARIGKYTPRDGGWTVENPPPRRVRDARNLLFHVLMEDFGYAPKPARECPWWPDKEDIEALNEAFKRIHEGMAVQCVKAPNKDQATRAEHCAICLLQPEYVAK